MQHPLAQLAQNIRTGQDRQHFWNFILPAAASLLGNMSKGRAEGRTQAAATNLSRDQLTTQQNQIQQQALLQSLLGAANQQTSNAQTDLARRNYTLQAPNARAATSVRGDIMSRSKPLIIGFSKGQIPTFSGGTSVADLSPESKQLGESMTRNALMQQLEGDTFDPLKTEDWKGSVLPQPGQTPLPKATGFDKFLSIASPALAAAGIGVQAASGSQNQSLIAQLLAQLQQKQGLPTDIPGGTTFGAPNFGG